MNDDGGLAMSNGYMYEFRSKAERRAGKFSRQKGLCHWCKKPMTLKFDPKTGKPPQNFASFEHLQRRRDGGAGKPFNVVLACMRCNSSRDAGVQITPPKPENVAARRMSDHELLALAKTGGLTTPQFGQLFSRGLVPNWPMWAKIMGHVPPGNP